MNNQIQSALNQFDFGTFKDLEPILDKAIEIFTAKIKASGDTQHYYSENAFILSLITRKKEHILKCLEDDFDVFSLKFEGMGREFYHEKVPYIDFIKSFSIFKELLIEIVANEKEHQYLIKEIYFLAKASLTYTSKGYLLSMINADIHGIEMLIKEESRLELSEEEASIRELLKWFHQLLLQVKKGGEATGSELTKCDTFLVFRDRSFVDENDIISSEYLEDMHKRLHIDAQSILFYLEQEDYSGMLPIYTSLLNIYKVSLYLMNSHQMKKRMRQMEIRIQEQENLKHQLEILVKERTQSLEKEVEERKKATELAIRANQSKSNFLANMSHEIRTPMNAVFGFNQLLLQTKLSDDQKEYVQKNINASNTLLTLINDILDLSKIEAGRIHLNSYPFNLDQLLKQCFELFEVEAEKKGLLLECEVDENLPKYLQGDRDRIHQVLINLVNNALKFTDRGSIHISVFMHEYSAHSCRVEFAVTDTGIGILKESHSDIFDLFTQVDNSAIRNAGGTGLGLTISKQLVEAMGGTIEVESDEGEGSTFSFILNFQIPEASLLNLGREEYGFDFHDLNILLAEDNDDNREVAVGILNHMGANVETALNGEEAVEMIRAKPYDLVLMDIQMPVKDGLSAAKTVRSDGFTKLPIIALSAHATPEEQQRSLDAGMNAHLNKPFKVVDLQNILLHYFPAKAIKKEDDSTIQKKCWANELPSLPGLVFNDEICDYWLNKEDFLHKLTPFIHNTQAESERLRTLINAKDTSAALRLLHKLKGNVKLYGAKRLFESIEELASALNTENYTDILNIRREFGVAVEELTGENTFKVSP